MTRPYVLDVLFGLATVAISCGLARRRRGAWRFRVARLIGLALAGDAAAWIIGRSLSGTWSAATHLPLALCDVALLVAAFSCWWRAPLAVELTYFWGLAGTLQAVITPDLSAAFPHAVLFEYVVGHLAIVWAALYLVVGLGCRPRPHAVRRVFAVTAGYTALVGLVDATTGADYMFLRKLPGHPSLLDLLGPWPYYIGSSALVALALFWLLDSPFRHPPVLGWLPLRARRV